MLKEGITIQAWLYDMAFFALIEEGEVQEAYRMVQLRAELNKVVPRVIWTVLLDKASHLLNVSIGYLLHL